MLPKFALALIRLQHIMIEVLECPSSRLLDCLLALSTQTYALFADALIETEECVKDYLMRLARNELKLMKKQKSAAMLNPTLTSLCLKLGACDIPKAQKLAKKIGDFTYSKVSNRP